MIAGAVITLLILLNIMIPVALAYTATINIDFDYTYPEDYNATLSSLATIEDIDNDGDYELVLYHSGNSSTGAVVEIPVNVSLHNTSINFVVSFAKPDGFYVYIVNASMVSAVNADPDQEWEDGFDLNTDAYGYLIGFDTYESAIKVVYRNETSSQTEITRVSYTFEYGVPTNVEIVITDGVLTVKINGEVVLGRSLPDLGIEMKYVVIGGRVGGFSASADCWVDDIMVFTSSGSDTSSTTTTTTTATTTIPSENVTTTTPTNTTTNTTATAITEKLSEWKDRISEWWGGLTTEQKIAIGVGAFIFLMILAMVMNPSRKVR